ncbi:MAG: SDR family oxidoreductase [Bacteriovoracaceae bacterium]|nr:SDR family oxidoreductase [Bacteriovoracaceae bacterium]
MNILITGCSSGFGKDLAESLSKDGHRVIATLRNLESRKSLFDHLDRESKERLLMAELDVTKTEQRERIGKIIETELDGKLDVLINNAGYGFYGPLEETSEEQIRAQLEVNFFGAALFTRGLIKYLRNGNGRVLNVTSLMGRWSMPLGSIYSASKYALEGLSEGLFYELSPFGIQVCTIQPGGHKTNFTGSIDWSKKKEGSLYESHVSILSKTIDKVMSNDVVPGSGNVTKTVRKLLKKKNMPRRVLVGMDAKATGIIMKLLPDFIYYPVLNFIFRRIISSSSKKRLT